MLLPKNFELGFAFLFDFFDAKFDQCRCGSNFCDIKNFPCRRDQLAEVTGEFGSARFTNDRNQIFK